MSNEKITIRIANGGQTTIQVEGVQGAGCTDLTKGLERALGTVEERTKTPDYAAVRGAKLNANR